MKDKFNQHKERLRYFRQINRQAMMMKAVKGIPKIIPKIPPMQFPRKILIRSPQLDEGRFAAP